MRGPTPSSLRKRVGPHALDKIRLWVMEEILPLDVQICRDGDSEWIKARDLPGFHNFPVELMEQIDERHERDKEEERRNLELITERQLSCLEFMGVSLSQGRALTNWRADKIIHQLAEFDPELYREWLSRSGPPRRPESIRVYTTSHDSSPSSVSDWKFSRPSTRGSSGNVIAAIASFFIPGLGQLAQGRIFFAFSCFAVAAFLWLMTFISLGLLFPVAFIVHILLGIAGCLDAARWDGRR